jgi:hypothetical protein
MGFGYQLPIESTLTISDTVVQYLASLATSEGYSTPLVFYEKQGK